MQYILLFECRTNPPTQEQHSEMPSLIHLRTFFDFYYFVTRQAKYVSRNIAACSCNHCCCGTAICITYSECVFVALGTHCEMNKRHIVICGLSSSTKFFHIISQTATFSEKRYWTQSVFGFSLQLLSETCIILGRTERHTIKNIYWSSCNLFLSDFNKTEFSRQI